MRRFRFVLVLSFVLHASAPLTPELMEAPKESHEASRVTHARSSLRSVRDVPAPRIADPTHAMPVRPAQLASGPRARPVTTGWVRKAPRSVPGPSSAREDH